MLWACAIASILGFFGITATNISFGVYSIAPAPLLGNPVTYQTIPNCNKPLGVCPPYVQNNIGIASLDFAIWFIIAFFVTFGILFICYRYLFTRTSMRKRTILPATLLIIALLVATLPFTLPSTGTSASLTLPRYQMSGGAPVHPLNVTIYSGTLSSTSSQGTAHMTLILANFDGRDLNESLSVYLVGPNITAKNPASIFQCSNSATCHSVTSITVPFYTALELNGTTTALYFGIEKGGNYRYDVNMTSEGIVTSGNVTAL